MRFEVDLPFINPARASLSTVRLDSKRYVVQDAKRPEANGLNAVFLTTGIVTECSLINPTTSWAPREGPVGAPVKRIRICPFSIEYERTVAFLGNLLDIEQSKSYNGPIYSNGLGFATRKESLRKGM